jgi:hypothetical protein
VATCAAIRQPVWDGRRTDVLGRIILKLIFKARNEKILLRKVSVNIVCSKTRTEVQECLISKLRGG